MIFKVNSEEFVRAIKPAVTIATKDITTDEGFKYKNLLTVKATKDKLILFAFSKFASIIAPVSSDNFDSLDYECEEEGIATVHGLDLMNAVTSIPPQKIKISLESNELKVNLTSKKKASKKTARSMATYSDTVKPPNIGKVYSQDIEVNRELFVKGMNSVIFAPAFEEKMYSYMCMLFEAIVENKDQTLRFSAGTGGRFAVKTIHGKHIITKGTEARIIFPNINLHNMSTILSAATCETIGIQFTDADLKNSIPEQIMIKFDGMVICILGLQYLTKYPDLTNIIQHKYSNRIYSNLDEWGYAVRGVDMSREMTRRNNKKDKDKVKTQIHNTKVIFEEEDELFMVTPQAPHACPTAVNIVDIKDCVAKGEDIWFSCNSIYLAEVIAQGEKTNKIQLNFESQAILDKIVDDKPKQMKPILVKYPEKTDAAKEITENFYIFFTVSTK